MTSGDILAPMNDKGSRTAICVIGLTLGCSPTTSGLGGGMGGDVEAESSGTEGEGSSPATGSTSMGMGMGTSTGMGESAAEGPAGSGETGPDAADSTGPGAGSSTGESDVVCENLLVNPSTESGNLDGWQILQMGGAEVRNEAAHDGSYAVHTSFSPFLRQQEIDLVAAGLDPAFLDTSPDIVIEDWFQEVYDSDEYWIRVELRAADHSTIEQWVAEDSTPGMGGTYDDDAYLSVSHTFSGYPAGVRYVLFRDGGQDGEYWQGLYGVVLDDARVEICHPQ